MKKIIIILFAIIGMIVGVAFGDASSTISGIQWLSIGGQLGFKAPIVLDLDFIQFTIGFWCKINIAGVFGMVIFALVSKKVVDWLKI